MLIILENVLLKSYFRIWDDNYTQEGGIACILLLNYFVTHLSPTSVSLLHLLGRPGWSISPLLGKHLFTVFPFFSFKF